MARIYAFRALRYNPAQVRLDDVVTQPYDKITPSMQQAYYRRSPYNLVRIILGLPELFDAPGADDVYSRAARDFREWRSTGILTVEKDPCIYAYAQRFAVPGSSGIFRERRGFIALGELRDYADGVVFPHEQTLPAPKSDRLSLLRATRAHFGQIFMLYSDPGQSAERMLFAPNATPDVEVTDEFGVQHSLSRVSDPAVINLVAGAMADKKLIIADGHHRYETALQYAREYRPETARSTERNSYTLPQPPYPESTVMMTFVNMDSEGIVILPSHRVVHGLGVFVASELMEKAGAFFTVEALTTADPAELTARLADAGRNGTALVVVTAEGRYLLTARPDAIADALVHLPERQRRLDVVVLHTILLEKLLGIPPEAVLEQTNIRYLRDAGEAVEQVINGDANLALLMNPVPLDQVREIAFAGEVLPQKSTDFYPKLLSGLTIYALD